MELFAIFVGMALICVGISTVSTTMGICGVVFDRMDYAERKLDFAWVAMRTAAGFGAVALFGLLFI